MSAPLENFCYDTSIENLSTKDVMRWIFFFVHIIAALLPLSVFAESTIAYFVEFEGVEDSKLLKLLKTRSQLVGTKKPPPSLSALRHRAEADVPELLKVLKAFGYYEAKIDFCIDEKVPKTRVLIYISTGPLYKVASFSLDLISADILAEELCQKIDTTELGIRIGAPMQSQEILRAKEKLLLKLSQNGYPLALLKKEEVIADGKTHLVTIHFQVDTGPLCLFGPVEITGATDIEKNWLLRKLAWHEGDLYNKDCLQETQKALIETGLFSTVIVTPGKVPDQKGSLPLNMELVQTLHRSINAGISYQTEFGPGITFAWECRNVAGEGEILRIQGDLTKLSHAGIISYRVPDFRRAHQNLSTDLEALQEKIEHVYHEKAYRLTSRLERRIGEHLRFSIGGRVEKMFVSESLQNGSSSLFQIPLYVGWANVNNLLNPTKGISLDYTLFPTVNFTKSLHLYMEQKFCFGSYFLVTKRSQFFTLAQKITLGTILSKGLHDVPLPERLLGGSEDDLRGYGYLTVSPLGINAAGKRQPLGGRSAIYYTLETRFRITDSIGLVPFFDLGHVWLNVLPEFHGKWRKSVGLGLRYFTFVGPLRFDVGFPLNRRVGLDNSWRVLVSIGQSF